MATYMYEALDQSGCPQRGAVNASSSDDAISRIRDKELFPTSVRISKNKRDLETVIDEGCKVNPVVFELKSNNWYWFALGVAFVAGLFFLIGICVGSGWGPT
jgi:hypothetical protein